MRKEIILTLTSIFINVVVLTISRLFWGMNVSCILAIFIYLFFTYTVFSQIGIRKYLLNLAIIFLGICIVHLPQRIVDFKSQLVSLPEFFCEILGVILGVLFFLGQRKYRIIVISAAMVISFFIYRKYEHVLEWINYSSVFYKSVDKIHIDSVPYYDTNNHIINESLFNSGHYIFLNIWSISCAKCISEFAFIDSINANCIHSERVELYTACILQNEDAKSALEVVKKRKCKFPVFTIPNWDIVKSKYDMDAVPVTFIIRNKRVLFRGSLMEAWNELNRLTGNMSSFDLN